jgi:hypothetical protein
MNLPDFGYFSSAETSQRSDCDGGKSGYKGTIREKN